MKDNCASMTAVLAECSAPLSADDMQKRRAKYTAVFAVVAFVSASAMGLQFLRFGHIGMVVFSSVVGILYLSTLLLYRFGFYRLAPLYLSYLVLAAISLANTLFLERDSGDYYLLLIVALSPLVVASEDRILGGIVTVLAILIFLSVQLLDWQRPFALDLVDAHTREYHAVVSVLIMMILPGLNIFLDSRLRQIHNELHSQYLRSEGLLHNILPVPIAEQLKAHTGPIAERFNSVTILFADIVGFTQLSQRTSPPKLVNILNRLFSEFDDCAEEFGIEKIKTIGDAYMAVSGLPLRQPLHAEAVARMALEIRRITEEVGRELNIDLKVRIGIHTGEVVAGVIGRMKFAYDLWGDAVNIAARMESHGLPGEIQLTEATRELLSSDFILEHRGILEVKGKGPMKTFLLKELSDL